MEGKEHSKCFITFRDTSLVVQAAFTQIKNCDYNLKCSFQLNPHFPLTPMREDNFVISLQFPLQCKQKPPKIRFRSA